MTLEARTIAVHTTPVGIGGVAGPSLCRAARTAGAKASGAEALIKALGSRFSFAGDVAPNDRFAMVVERQRAAMGETRLDRFLRAQFDQWAGRAQVARLRAIRG